MIVTKELVQSFINIWSAIQWTDGSTPGTLPKLENTGPMAESALDSVFAGVGLKTAFAADDGTTDMGWMLGVAVSNMPCPTTNADGSLPQYDWTSPEATNPTQMLLVTALGVAYNYGML